MKPMIQRNLWLKAPPERVWRAITEPEQIQKWFSPTIPWAVSKFEVGGLIYAVGYESQAGTIDVIDPPREFTYHWDSLPPEPPYRSVMSYRLEEENGGTRLRFSESGFEALPGDLGAKRAKQNNAGWKMGLANLKAYLEGQPLPYPNGL